MRVFAVLIIFFLLSSALVSCGGGVEVPVLVKIDSEAAFAYAEKYVSLGLKTAGTDGARRAAEWIKSVLPDGVGVTDEFTDVTPEGVKTFRNVYADTCDFKGGDFVIIACHYDTKELPFSPGFEGANDGASGVAALLALADHVFALPPEKRPRIRFYFFDGEEALYAYSENDGLHGSRHAAKVLLESGASKHCKAFILLDMIGDSDLRIMTPVETSDILRKGLKRIALKHGTGKFFNFGTQAAMHDDHIPFLDIGIPAVDMIDFEYGRDNMYWHTSSDTLDKISGASIALAASHAFALAEMVLND